MEFVVLLPSFEARPIWSNEAGRFGLFLAKKHKSREPLGDVITWHLYGTVYLI